MLWCAADFRNLFLHPSTSMRFTLSIWKNKVVVQKALVLVLAQVHKKLINEGGSMVNQELKPIAILGAGSWGTALALYLARRGQTVRLWSIENSEITAML